MLVKLWIAVPGDYGDGNGYNNIVLGYILS
jgi:hypothetical protein